MPCGWVALCVPIRISSAVGWIGCAPSRQRPQEYDFALSFAGEDRVFAEKLHDHLSDLNLSVFYDHAEQHRLLAEDIEEFLGPIYESGVVYVIAVLGREYELCAKKLEELCFIELQEPATLSQERPSAFGGFLALS